VKGIETGDFYASTGVRFDEIKRTGNEFHLAIRTQPGRQLPHAVHRHHEGREPRFEGTTRQGRQPAARDQHLFPGHRPGRSGIDGADRELRVDGKELYVRAKVISTKPHPNPYAKGDVEVAWTQPVVP